MDNSLQKKFLEMLKTIDKNTLENNLKKISNSLSDNDKQNLLKNFNNLNKGNK